MSVARNEHQGLRSEADIVAFESAVPLHERIPPTVYEVFENSAVRHGDACALSMVVTAADDERPARLTYRQLLGAVTQAANLFHQVAGVDGGIAYMLPSLFETHSVLWGAETVGYAVPINPLLEPEHIVRLIGASGASALTTCGPDVSSEIWAKAKAIQARLPGLKLVVVRAPQGERLDPETFVDFDRQVSRLTADQLQFDLDRDPHRVVAYFHTGGTTAAPKLVSHTHRNQLTAALGSSVLFDIRSSDVVTNGMPLFHVGGAIANSLAVFIQGGHVVTLSPFGLRNPAMVQNFWGIAEREGVTILAAVPTALSAVLAVPCHAALSRVRFGITGSAPTPQKVAKRFAEVTGTSLYEMLGMTESGGATAVDPTAAAATTASVGFRLPYTTLRVLRRKADGTLGEDCAPEEVGALTVEGPHVSPGYRDEHDAGLVFREGTLDSGDLAYKGTDGKLFIAGRAKDLIIRGGHNIDPLGIEEAFLAHPQVAAAAAIGQLDSYAGEVPVCFVVLTEGATTLPAELLEFACERINERPAWPKCVYLLSKLPLTAVGKVFKPALREEAAQRILQEVVSAEAADLLKEVRVTQGGKRGLRATVVLHASSDEVRERIQRALNAFVIDVRFENQ